MRAAAEAAVILLARSVNQASDLHDILVAVLTLNLPLVLALHTTLLYCVALRVHWREGAAIVNIFGTHLPHFSPSTYRQRNGKGAKLCHPRSVRAAPYVHSLFLSLLSSALLAVARRPRPQVAAATNLIITTTTTATDRRA